MRSVTVSLIALLLGVFCPSVVGDECPDLVGTWDFVSGEIESEYGDYAVISDVEFDSEETKKLDPEEMLVIETQNGCFFEGYSVHEFRNEIFTVGFSGALGTDGKTIYFVDHESGFGFGELVSPTEMTMYWMSHFNTIGEDGAQILIMNMVKQSELVDESTN